MFLMPATSTSLQDSTHSTKDHWAVRMNHRNRTWGFFMLGLISGMHIWHSHPTWYSWVLLAGTFVIYPQAAWYVARRSALPLRQEVWHMLFDAFLCGAWSAALHFPLWITFALCISVLLNLTLFRGLAGLAQAAVCWCLGALAVGSVIGWTFMPDTDWPVTLTSLATLGAFLLITAVDNYKRSMSLHHTREKLISNEHHLQRQLEEISDLRDQLKQQSESDSLTGLYSRYRLADVLVREMARCKRTRQALSLVLIDIDHFKNINERWGHQVGDEVLRQLASMIKSQTRSNDWCFRYGGGEFLLLLPGTDTADAIQKAEMLRTSVCAKSLMCAGLIDVEVTVSAGLSTFPTDATEMDDLISSADNALHRAKREGRNLVAAATVV